MRWPFSSGTVCVCTQCEVPLRTLTQAYRIDAQIQLLCFQHHPCSLRGSRLSAHQSRKLACTHCRNAARSPCGLGGDPALPVQVFRRPTSAPAPALVVRFAGSLPANRGSSTRLTAARVSLAPRQRRSEDSTTPVSSGGEPKGPATDWAHDAGPGSPTLSHWNACRRRSVRGEPVWATARRRERRSAGSHPRDRAAVPPSPTSPCLAPAFAASNRCFPSPWAPQAADERSRRLVAS